MPEINSLPHQQLAYPASLLVCPNCQLVQIGLIVDPEILFPPEYPYTSGTTRILRENFAELYQECSGLIELSDNDLIIDVGSNDGTLLSNFVKHRVLGIEPTDAGKLALERGIPTITSYFSPEAAAMAVAEHGEAKVVTATNVFAHIENVHNILEGIVSMLSPEGFFISESHYLMPLLETNQFDTIYHEHLRYYSLHSLKYLLEMHGLELIHARQIPTHGGSIRVYAAHRSTHRVRDSIQDLLRIESEFDLTGDALVRFKNEAVLAKLSLYQLLADIKKNGKKIYGIGAPSRASTLISYVGLDEGVVDCILEIQGSHKIGKYMPGTVIPVVDESCLFTDQPDYALIFSWHIAEELIPKLTEKGYKGQYILPLPTPRLHQA